MADGTAASTGLGCRGLWTEPFRRLCVFGSALPGSTGASIVDENVGSIEVVLPGNPDQGEQRIAPSVSKSRPHPVRGGGFAGRSKSSRNVYRHGLSCPLPLDPAMSAKVDAIGQALIGEAASEEQLKSAAEFAQAQLELLRIRAIRAEMMKDADLKLGDTQDLRRLAALDRYERLAQTRRRRASHKL